MIIVGVVGWRVWDVPQQKSELSSNASTASVASTTAPVQIDPNEGYVVISEWGVRFKPVEGLKDVRYFKPRIVSTDAFSFTTAEMDQSELRCGTSTDMIPFGLLQRSKTADPTAGGEVATINGYVYQYRSTDAACSENPANLSQEGKITGQIMQSIESLEASK